MPSDQEPLLAATLQLKTQSDQEPKSTHSATQNDQEHLLTARTAA